MRWTAVVNPTAGRGRTRKLLPRLVDALAGVDLDVDVRVSEDLDDAIRIARDSFDDGRGVAACGGDGTVNALAGVAGDSCVRPRCVRPKVRNPPSLTARQASRRPGSSTGSLT